MHIYMFIVHIFWIGMGNYTSLTIQSTFSITCTLGCTTLATGYILCQTENANKRDFLGLFLTWPAFCITCSFVPLKTRSKYIQRPERRSDNFLKLCYTQMHAWNENHWIALFDSNNWHTKKYIYYFRILRVGCKKCRNWFKVWFSLIFLFPTGESWFINQSITTVQV